MARTTQILKKLQEAKDLAERIDTGKRLEGVKKLMRSHQVSIYLVPTEDAHGSEYISAADARREYITGFTGSAGTALILLDHPHSLLFTDGRYFNQASKQLHPSYWKLMKQGLKHVPTWPEYLVKSAAEAIKESDSLTTATPGAHLNGLRIGLDPTLVSAKEAQHLATRLKKYSAELVSLKQNLIDIQWNSSRPNRPQNPIQILHVKYSGQTSLDKLGKIQDKLKALSEEKNQNLIGMVVSALDEIAWTLNLRGSDIPYNPVFFAYLWIGKDGQVILFVKEEQLNPTLNNYLKDNGVEIKSYESIWDFLQQLNGTTLSSPSSQTNPKVLISNVTSLAVENNLGGDSKTIQIRSPIQDMKAIKNATEIEGFRKAHIRDGAALVTYFSWLEEYLLNSVSENNSNSINEFDAALQLTNFRKEFGGDFFQGLSFTTISSSGKNAAIIHYSPDPLDSAIVNKDEVYLCDSGAQYLDGTTDVTRTWHFGTPTEEEKRANTRVLQGHIHIAEMKFPEKTTGNQLDPFARQYLWQDGLDYPHGTGHGVGHFLNVHEGPQGISARQSHDSVALKAGMTLSNEPGYYKDEGFGIRIESIVVVKRIQNHKSTDTDDDSKDPNEKIFFGFEYLTMCPIQVKLLDINLLSSNQINWLNSYHKEVLNKLTPLLKNHPKALNWLIKECQPI